MFYIYSSGVSLDISTRSGFNRARWNTGQGTSQSTETRTYITILTLSTSVKGKKRRENSGEILHVVV